MKAQQLSQRNITIPKETFRCMVRDFEHLLKDFEKIAEGESVKVVEKRLKDVKEGKVRGFTEKDFSAFLKKEGIDA